MPPFAIRLAFDRRHLLDAGAGAGAGADVRRVRAVAQLERAGATIGASARQAGGSGGNAGIRAEAHRPVRLDAGHAIAERCAQFSRALLVGVGGAVHADSLVADLFRASESAQFHFLEFVALTTTLGSDLAVDEVAEVADAVDARVEIGCRVAGGGGAAGAAPAPADSSVRLADGEQTGCVAAVVATSLAPRGRIFGGGDGWRRGGPGAGAATCRTRKAADIVRLLGQ